jgi:hypothetical protein
MSEKKRGRKKLWKTHDPSPFLQKEKIKPSRMFLYIKMYVH